MEESSATRQSAADLPIGGMESVVATVSGYHGSQRFRLIKLISLAGASYVGTLNQSTTHLICWKFEGRKYEIARKLKVLIVNHMWIEDCIRRGRFLPEHSYTLSCGKEIGHLLMDMPVIANNVSHLHLDRSVASSKSRKHVIDVEIEENDDAVWNESSLLKENLAPRVERNTKSCRSRRKGVKDCSRTDPFSSAKYHSDELPLSCYTNVKVRQKRKTAVEPSRSGRKLVRNNRMSDILEALTESEEDCSPAQVHNWQDDVIAPSSNSSGWSNRSMLRMRGASGDTFCNRRGNRFDDSEDEENKDLSGFPSGNSLSTEVASTSAVNVVVDETCIYKDSNEIEPASRLPESSELSCVICWTEFSSTRGVLPCGHRFCFSCIQSWADHRSASQKNSTCPLCKASFGSIAKVDDAVFSDQKIYSQTIPHDPSVDIYILPNHEAPTFRGRSASLATVCSQCSCKEPEDLLIRCHLCQITCIHSYCLDPYMLPWTCLHCKDLRRRYHPYMY